MRGSAALLLAALLTAACATTGLRSAVTLSLTRGSATPGDALVYIDEEFVAPLAVIAARGVRLPEGEHRLTVQKDGYFPWDRLVVSDREPIRLEVVLERVPD
jgi:hypothetical protein